MFACPWILVISHFFFSWESLILLLFQRNQCTIFLFYFGHHGLQTYQKCYEKHIRKYMKYFNNTLNTHWSIFFLPPFSQCPLLSFLVNLLLKTSSQFLLLLSIYYSPKMVLSITYQRYHSVSVPFILSNFIQHDILKVHQRTQL